MKYAEEFSIDKVGRKLLNVINTQYDKWVEDKVKAEQEIKKKVKKKVKKKAEEKVEEKTKEKVE